MIETLIAQFLSNFSVAMVVLGMMLALISIACSRLPQNRELITDRLLAYQLLCAVGFCGIYYGIAHTVFNDTAARFIGWQPSPFQYEVGMANFALGVLGLFAFRINGGFRAATVIATTVILIGAWAGHIYQQVVHHNYAPGNAGSIFYTDLLIPVILLTLYLIRYRPQR